MILSDDRISAKLLLLTGEENGPCYIVVRTGALVFSGRLLRFEHARNDLAGLQMAVTINPPATRSATIVLDTGEPLTIDDAERIKSFFGLEKL
jgi:hypothetical protein